MEWWLGVAKPLGATGIPPVETITVDSRQVRPGTAFIAVPGGHSDGHDYLDAAHEAGAAALVVQADHESKWAHLRDRAALLVVEDARAAVGPLAAAVHGHPSARLVLVGVTGTDGKTTTSHLAAHVLSACGIDCGYLTSVGFDTGTGFEANESHMTTLEATSIQSRLADAVGQGRRAMVVEASSEGLAQHRLEGCEFDVAVFTNLTRDHLDFHGTMERYLAAKGRLFEMLELPSAKGFPRAAVLNADDPASDYLQGLTAQRVISYGLEREAALKAIDLDVDTAGLSFRIVVGGQELPARAPLMGRFNVYNCLAAVAIAISQGAPLPEAVESLSSFAGVPARMEVVDCGQAFRVVIDIASTPAALENVLKALRPATAGRLWAMFGAAGGRDPARREGMGRVAGRLADRVVLTNEDPRDEDPDGIIDAIAGGLVAEARTEGRDFVRRPDRREAIAYTFEHAQPGDTVLLAGKANETSMIFGTRHVPWDERAVAVELLRGTGDRR